MEPMCDFCGGVKAVVYCKSDLARLCLNCDGCVHFANILSLRHARSLLCDKRHAQPAIARCMDEKLSFCQCCDWNGNGCLSLGHRRLALNCYTGCPSTAEFAMILSLVLEASLMDSFDVGWPSSTLPINENYIVSEKRENKGSFGLVATELNRLESCPKLEPWLESSSVVQLNPNYMPYSFCRDQVPLFLEETNMPLDCSDLKDLNLPDGDDMCEGVSIGNVPLNIGTSDQISLLGNPHIRTN